VIPLAAAEQPIQFSHKLHAPLKIECRYCHTTVETGDKASFPAVEQCMTCHRAVKKDSPEIQRLAALGKDAKPFPTQRVYTVPDFVIFSHAVHRKASIDCGACHGAVSKHDAITLEVPVAMKACVACHKGRQASLLCNTCHELGQ
jgi:hypothetical protein